MARYSADRSMWKSARRAWSLACLAAAAVAPVLAGMEGSLPERIEVEARQLVLNGSALRKVAFIRIYVAGLYLPERRSDADSILSDDQPRGLMMHFLRDVDAARLCEGWDHSLAQNTPDPGEALLQQFATLCSFMEDAHPGERLVFQYIPGEGTSVTAGGTVRGPIAGKEFADALFRTWLGPRAIPGEDFKRQLLGR